MCGAVGSGGDLVYAFDLPQAMTVSVSSTPVGRALRPVLYLRKTNCSSTALADEVGCNLSPTAGDTAALTLSNLAAGRYWIWVDSAGVDTGPFALAVHLTPPPPIAANDSCASPLALYAALADYASSCSPLSGPDLVYSLRLSQPQSVSFAVTPTTGTLRPMLYLQTACGDVASEKGCSATLTPGSAGLLTFPVLGTGSYYLVVDSGTAGTTGPFTLEAQLGAPPPPPPSDLCTGANPLTWSGTTATATDDTSLGSDDDRSYCSSTSTPLNGPDLVYQFELTASARVTAVMTAATHTPAYRPAVSIRRGCAPEDEVACELDSGRTSTTSASLAPGIYYVFVDGVSSAVNGSAYGYFTLALSQSTAVDADGCGNPSPIALDSTTGVGVVRSTLANATASGDGSCLPDTGADLVYSFALATEKRVQVALTSLPAVTAL